jgi:hypothetical protein
MRICVGHITARCDQCGCEDFQPAPGETTPAQELACFGCGLRTTRRALLMQVADETVRRADAFLEASRKLRSRPSR